MSDPELSDVEKAEADEMIAKIVEEEEADTQRRILSKIPMRYQAHYAAAAAPPAPAPEPEPEPTP